MFHTRLKSWDNRQIHDSLDIYQAQASFIASNFRDLAEVPELKYESLFG